MLSKKQVKHIAKLANFSLTEEEIKKFQKQLGDILDYIEILNELDTDNIEPTSQVTGLKNIFKKDEIIKEKQLNQKEALSGAKQKYRGYFRIKGIFE